MSSNVLSKREFTSRALIVVGLAGATLGLAAILWQISQVLLLIGAGILFAVLLDSFAFFLQKVTRLHRRPALLLASVFLLVLAAAMAWYAGPFLVDQISQLFERIPRAVQEMQSLLRQYSWGRILLKNMPAAGQLVPSGADIVGRISGVFSTTLGMVVNVTIVILLGFYVALNPQIYVAGILRLVPPSGRARGAEVLLALGHALRWWLVGRLAAMIAVGVLVTIAMWSINVPFAIALGVIAGLLSFVPFLGPVIAAIPAILIGMMEDPLKAVYVVVVYSVVQFLEGNFITPVIQAYAVSLPPAMLLSAQLIMGVLFGIMGIVLATPFTVTLIVLVQTVYVKGLLGDSINVLGEHPRPRDGE